MWNMTIAQAPARGGGEREARPLDTGVGVLDRSIAVLDAVEAGATSFTKIVDATGLPRTTAHRLMKALEAHGFVMFDEGYRLGPRLLRLAASAAERLPLRDLAHPVLERLAAATGESTQLYVLEGTERVCVDAVESRSELRTIVPVGASLPLTAGSAGKVFLAWGPTSLRDRSMRRPTRFTDDTPDAEQLARDLAAARRRGWAWSGGERQAGVGSVSAPVFDAHGTLVAAVSVSGPASRLGRSSATRYATAVLAAAEEIGSTLGVA
jgi:DNA-binding IclR family transcriptional regulator